MIENTSSRDAFVHMLGAMGDGPDGYVTGMEAAGQRQVVNGAELPKEGPWPELEALGFVRGEPVDELFVQATLPEGWSKRATDHSMHSKIVDERGIERVSVFYKAAFYDRRADMHLVSIGRKLATKACWGDGLVALPDCWAILTDAEKRGYATALDHDLSDNLENQQLYTGEGLARKVAQADRIRAFQTLIPAEADE